MAHVTLDLSKYDALTAYKGLPDEKEENPARFFPCLLYTSDAADEL